MIPRIETPVGRFSSLGLIGSNGDMPSRIEMLYGRLSPSPNIFVAVTVQTDIIPPI